MEIKKLCCGPFMTNTYLIINEKNAVIVDPGLGLEKFKNLFDEYKIEAIILTHGHIDHIACIDMFDCKIYLNNNEVSFLKDTNLNLAAPFGYYYHKPNNQVISVYDNQIINIIGLDMKFIHTPGHTLGSMCVLVDNFLFSGDTLFECSIGRTDFPTGSLRQMNESLIKLIDNLKDDTIVYPGHGNETTIGFEKKYNQFYLQAK